MKDSKNVQQLIESKTQLFYKFYITINKISDSTEYSNIIDFFDSCSSSNCVDVHRIIFKNFGETVHLLKDDDTMHRLNTTLRYLGSKLRRIKIKDNQGAPFLIYKVPDFVELYYSQYYQLKYLVIDSKIIHIPAEFQPGFESKFLTQEWMQVLRIPISYFMIWYVEIDKEFTQNQIHNLKRLVFSLDDFDNSNVILT